MLQTVDRALRLLLLFEEVGQEYRVGELAAMLGVDKSIASRLAATLANQGFLERAPGSEAFRLGPMVGRLGMLALGSSHNLMGLARAPMERLAEETGETVNLAVLKDDKAVNVAQVDGPHLVGVGDWTGWKAEPHATANGKVLLAFAGSEFEDLPLEIPLKTFTERTITSLKEMRSELERVRSAGWGSTLGELEKGFNGVAVPVFDVSGRCLAALSVSGPVYRMPPQRLPKVAQLCEKIAEEIGARLGITSGIVRISSGGKPHLMRGLCNAALSRPHPGGIRMLLRCAKHPGSYWGCVAAKTSYYTRFECRHLRRILLPHPRTQNRLFTAFAMLQNFFGHCRHRLLGQPL